MKLTYTFSNNESDLNSFRSINYFDPKKVSFAFKNGDMLYVSNETYVYRNQLLIKSENGIKTYAPISGYVKIDERFLTIENDYKELINGRVNANKNIFDFNRSDALKLLDSLGLEIDNKFFKNVIDGGYKVIVINGVDALPYEFDNRFTFRDNVREILEVIDFISKRMNMDTCLFLSSKDKTSLNTFNSFIGSFPNVYYKIVNEVFPFNMSSLLVKKYLKNYKDEEILYMDVNGIYKLYYALKRNMVVSEKYVTVVYPDTNIVFTVRTKYGVTIEDLLKKCIDTDYESYYDIYVNNFMRRVKISDIKNSFVMDNIKVVFVCLKNDDKSLECFNCGLCSDICPIKLNPTRKLDSRCIKCGLCNFACPSRINLLTKKDDL